MFRWLVIALAASSPLPGALGHAGSHSEDEIKAEISLRNTVAAASRRAIERCANSDAAQGVTQRALARRASTAHAVRMKRRLQSEHVHARRDTAALEKWATISHNETSSAGFSLNTPTSTIFASNTTCVLVPETVIGPYYVDGELIRTDITDGQAGVPVHLDVQFVDLDTCAGVSSLLVDIWHCNATGVYSGVGNNQGGLDTTHGRGAQESDRDGVVQFDTLFPGHYTGRATHIHIMATANATILPNQTFTGGTARHIGQMYFDETLRTAVESLAPYNTNTQSVTTNAEDMLAPDEATAEYDPFLDYVMLGDKLEDGLLMWITIGINTSADHSTNVTPAAHYLEGGGVSTGQVGGGPGAGGQPSGGNMPPPGPGNGTGSATNVSTSISVVSVVSSAGAARRTTGWLPF